MNAIYHSFPTIASEDTCPICLDALQDTDAVAHENGGEKHPLHRTCAKTHALSSNICPVCRSKVDNLSLQTCLDKQILILKPIAEDALQGAIYGLSLAVASVAAAAGLGPLPAALLTGATAGLITCALDTVLNSEGTASGRICYAIESLTKYTTSSVAIVASAIAAASLGAKILGATAVGVGAIGGAGIGAVTVIAIGASIWARILPIGTSGATAALVASIAASLLLTASGAAAVGVGVGILAAAGAAAAINGVLQRRIVGEIL